jgi:hypothetical protein
MMTGQKYNKDKKEVCEMWERILKGTRSGGKVERG